MTTKKVVPVKPVAKKKSSQQHVRSTEVVIEVTAEQVAGFLSRITSALEKIQKMHAPQPQEYVGLERASVPAHISTNGSVGKAADAPPSPPSGLGQKINYALDAVRETYSVSQDIVDRLRGDSVQTNAAGGKQPTSGPMKDGVDEVRSLIYEVTENLRVIGEYIFA